LVERRREVVVGGDASKSSFATASVKLVAAPPFAHQRNSRAAFAKRGYASLLRRRLLTVVVVDAVAHAEHRPQPAAPRQALVGPSVPESGRITMSGSPLVLNARKRTVFSVWLTS
jgi:hypothetical protein